MAHWTSVLTVKEKKHLHNNVTVLIGMGSKRNVIAEIKKCPECSECRAILQKLGAA